MAVDGNAMISPGTRPLHNANNPSFLNIFDNPSYTICSRVIARKKKERGSLTKVPLYSFKPCLELS
jgi:hypothetical protein